MVTKPQFISPLQWGLREHVNYFNGTYFASLPKVIGLLTSPFLRGEGPQSPAGALPLGRRAPPPPPPRAAGTQPYRPGPEPPGTRGPVPVGRARSACRAWGRGRGKRRALQEQAGPTCPLQRRERGFGRPAGAQGREGRRGLGEAWALGTGCVGWAGLGWRRVGQRGLGRHSGRADRRELCHWPLPPPPTNSPSGNPAEAYGAVGNI